MKWFPHRALASCAVLAAASFMIGCGGDGKDVKDPSDAVGDSDGEDGGGESAPEVGKTAPEVKGESIMGEGPKNLADGRGQVVIVDFWATFCDPCRKSFPQYQELVDKHAGKLAIIAVSVDDPDDVGVDDVKKFATDLGVSFSIVWDKDKSTANVYKPPKMPTSYVVDKQGIIRHIHEGFSGGEAEELDKEVEALLK